MMAWLWRFLLKPILFRLDAEFAHELGSSLIRWMGRLRVGRVSAITLGAGCAQPNLGSSKVFGKQFRNRVGLAAGFDKNGLLLRFLPDFGFGFVEVGTVTPKPQGGNPRPRLFRLPEDETLFNKMGFNSLGASLVAQNVARARARGLPQDFRVGINVGKNKDTDPQDAPKDYRSALKPFRDLVDYAAVNVSSPNTPGLRSLQSVEALKPIVMESLEELSSWGAGKTIPLLVKFAPEIFSDGDSYIDLIVQTESWGVAGILLTNTLGGHFRPPGLPEQAGGLSGGRVRAEALRALELAKKHVKMPIISVGGIDSAAEARLRLSQGASLVQIYSGWVYKGPNLPAQILRGLSQGH